MSTLKLILTKDNNIYPNPNDASDSDLFRRLTGDPSALPFISIQDFNNNIKPILINYGIKYTIYREGEEKVTNAVIEALRILEKVCCEYDSAYQLRDKTINLLKKINNMSRYTSKNSKNEIVIYGYDNMLREYFLYPEDEDEPEINNRQAIIDYLDKGEFPIPQRHKDNLLLDLPI